MQNKKFVDVKISDYAPMNPDTSPSSKPVNAYFEIRINLASVNDGYCMDAADSFNVLKNSSQTDEALPAAAVSLANLVYGDYPLFKNCEEAEAFQKTLIINDDRWSCGIMPGSDMIVFTYNGKQKTLNADFSLFAYSKEFNTTADYSKKRADIKIISNDFQMQFEDAFDDDYTISTMKVYVPWIASFAPQGLSPVMPGTREYGVSFGDETEMSWEIHGDMLNNAALTQDNNQPETVGLTQSINRKILFPTVFDLYAENKTIKHFDRVKISIILTSCPRIEYFEPDSFFCLAGGTVKLNFETSAALVCNIDIENSTEEKIKLDSASGTVNAYPALPEKSSSRIVKYKLTAKGHKGRENIEITNCLEISVSRWKKHPEKSVSIPVFDNNDLTAAPFEYLSKYYCFSGRAIWESVDGREWIKIAAQTLSSSSQTVPASFAFFEGYVYILNYEKNDILYLSKYNLMKEEWLPEAIFSNDDVNPGGSFSFINKDLRYYFEPKKEYINIYNYSPAPFNVWGIAGSLKIQAPVSALDTYLFNGRIYLIAACDDKKIRIFNFKYDLQDEADPLIINADAQYVKFFKINSRLCAAAGTIIVDAVSGIQEDMMFSDSPGLLGNIFNQPAGIDKSCNIWTMGLS